MEGPKKRWSDAIIRPAKRTLFGDETYAGAVKGPECVDVVPLAQALRDVCSLRWEDWTDYAFAREPLNGRLNDELRAELMEGARACGDTWARFCEERFGSADPHDIAKGLGVSIFLNEKPHSQDRIVFAEFVEPDRIYVYADALDKAQTLLDDSEVRETLGPVSPQSILLAHEVFHAVELAGKERVWSRYHKVDVGFGFLHSRVHLAVLDELAAMGFAQALLGLTYSPYVMDVFLTYCYSPVAGSSLYHEVMGKQPLFGADEDKAEGPTG